MKRNMTRQKTNPFSQRDLRSEDHEVLAVNIGRAVKNPIPKTQTQQSQNQVQLLTVMLAGRNFSPRLRH